MAYKIKDLEEIKSSLKNTKGLNFITFLNEKHKRFIIASEEINNMGVFEALKKDYVALITHDPSFRDPVREIVIKKENGVFFPPVPFPEINAEEVVSSSPSSKVHDNLLNQLNILPRPEEATLIVGFNLAKKFRQPMDRLAHI